MNFNCNQQSCLKRFSAYCCAYRRELLRNNNFVSTIDIVPRVVICKKLEVCESYYQPITVKNNGTLTRRLTCFTDPNSDIQFRICGTTELTSGSSFTIEMFIEPTSKKYIKRNRFFYILAEHPDIVWELPILVIGDNPELFVPDLVCLHKVPGGTNTHYQFVIFNPTDNDATFTISSNFEGLTTSPEEGVLLANNYAKVIISCKIASTVMTTSLMVSVKNGKSYRICIHTEPSDQVIHLSTSMLQIEDTFMGSKVKKNVIICNKSMDTVSFQWSCSESLEDLKTSDKVDEILTISDYLKIRNKRGCISPLSSALAIVTFEPPFGDFYNDEEEPPFPFCNTIYLFCPILGPNSYRFQISGNILGPDIEVNIKDLELGNLFLGQMLCNDFTFSNKGPIPGEINFQCSTDQNDMRCTIVPNSLNLSPGDSGVIHLSFYRRNVGKFISKLVFKIKYGVTVCILLRGTSQPAKVKFWPDFFEFGNLPICIPQKRIALVINPLPVPIVVLPKIVEDGESNPLILCVDDTKIPTKARPAAYYNLQCREKFAPREDDEIKPDYSNFCLSRGQDFIKESASEVSYVFKEQVLDDIPDVVEKFLVNVKNINVSYEPEPGFKIVDAALDCLLEQSDYFHSLKVKQNYLNMDWQALPTDAKEVAIESEKFYLKPGESKSFPVVLIPNSSGPAVKFIEFQACPLGIETSDIKSAIRSKYLVNSLRLQYKCSVPSIEYNENMKFVSTLYVNLVYPFTMNFKNMDDVPGFVFFKAVPSCEEGKMEVDEQRMKFFIKPDEEIVVNCSVIYKQVGTVALHGLFQLVGKILEFPFKVAADVIPPEVGLSDDKIIWKQRVLTLEYQRLFIENICPTIAQFSISLKNDAFQYLEPQGGSLRPDQKIVILINSKFYDPGTYKNYIILNIKHAELIHIPMTYTVYDYPLIFEPNIKEGWNLGTVFRKSSPHKNLVKITNYGKKFYKLYVIPTKMKRKTKPPPSAFEILPGTMFFAPGATETINFRVRPSLIGEFIENFTINGVDGDNTCFKFFSFLCSIKIIKEKLVWNKTDICLVKKYGCDQSNICDSVALINTTPLACSVSLTITGYFQFKETGSKESEFDLPGNASTTMTIKLSQTELLGDVACEYYEGLVKCKANNRIQNSLNLRAKIVCPVIKIYPDDITLFTQDIDSYSHIEITNCSEIDAKFSWNLKTVTVTKPDKYECPYALTVAEKILALPEAIVKKPIFIKPEEPEVYQSELESWEDMESTTQSKTKSTTQDSSNTTSTLTKSKSSSQTTSSKSSRLKSSSTNSQTVSRKSSSKKTEICKMTDDDNILPETRQPVFITTKTDTKFVSVNRVLEYLEHLKDGKTLISKTAPFDTNQLEGNAETETIETKSPDDDEKESNGIIFQQPSGCITSQVTYQAYMFLPPMAEECTITSEFDLQVTGGPTEVLKVAVTGVKGRIQLSITNVDLGKAAWYKTISNKVTITNQCQFSVKISLIENPNCGTVDKKLYNGHVAVGEPLQYVLDPKEQRKIEWKAIYGFRFNFFEDIGVEVNNSVTPIQIHFHGIGQMPMVFAKNLDRASRGSLETIASYLTMRSVFEGANPKYYAQTMNGNGDAGETIEISETLTISEDEEENSASNRPPKKRAKRDKTNEFVALDYSENTGPKAIEIERLIETGKLIDKLAQSDSLRYKLHRFYCNCVRYKAMEFESVINLRYTICRPIPWEQPVFIANLGKIGLNDTKNYEVELQFTGPGRAYLSARTHVSIPGLMAWFESSNRISVKQNMVTFVQTPDEKKFKTYKSMKERNSSSSYIDNQGKYKKAHAHSYDLGEEGEHTRVLTLQQVEEIKAYYSKIGQPPKERKSTLVLGEVCQTTDEVWDNKVIKLIIMLTVLGKYYERGQKIEERLLVDVHMGPTLPILVKAQVSKD